MNDVQNAHLVNAQTALQGLESWRNEGQITAQNQVAYFAFLKSDLLALLNQPLVSGIRFHLAWEKPSEKINLLAAGVKTRGGKAKTLINQFYQPIYQSANSNFVQSDAPKANLPTSSLLNSLVYEGLNTQPLAKTIAQTWIEHYQNLPILQKMPLARNWGNFVSYGQFILKMTLKRIY
jgi:hypothetical protein